MIGLLVELLLSWLLLWFFAKRGLSALELVPSKSRLYLLALGFLFAGAACAAYNLLSTSFINNGWIRNAGFKNAAILTTTWWVLKSVLFEEFIFRGTLLYLATKKWGVRNACILSAVCFGVYHWFSYNSFGNPMLMLIIFLMTGIFGFALAMAFAKTGTLLFPIGIHFGWNLVNILAFSNGPLGMQLFTKANSNELQGISSLLVFLFQVIAVPAATLGYLYIRNKRSIVVAST